MKEEKEYSVKELASILGCSVTAVQKKIKTDENNPEIKRYKNRFNTVVKDGKLFILLTDSELEEEKRLSKGFNNVVRNVAEDDENVINVEYTTESQANKEDVVDKIINFTNGYIQRYETLQKTYYDELQQKDKQIFLLTTSENKTKDEINEMQSKITISEAKATESENKSKELEKRNRLLMLYLTVVTTLFITLVGLFITFYINVNNLNDAETEKPSIEQVSTVENVNNEIEQSNKVEQKPPVKSTKRHKKTTR